MLNNNIYAFQNNGIKQNKFDIWNGGLNNIDNSDGVSDNNNNTKNFFFQDLDFIPYEEDDDATLH
jgi:hypothetical protein